MFSTISMTLLISDSVEKGDKLKRDMKDALYDMNTFGKLIRKPKEEVRALTATGDAPTCEGRQVRRASKRSSDTDPPNFSVS
ncbi:MULTISPECIES: hypothetical protein [unclassified Streptomyces]|uniref:hypothetical protein n=1 Tax=unclassified Streptomyces TaxID=2593676 RepID=UPI002E309575|nr:MULTISPECIES: hypothetical protein [unclassified Streptomyces]